MTPGRPHPDPHATGAPEPPPGAAPGAAGRENHERAAAAVRGQQRSGEPDYRLCAPDVPGLQADLIFTLHAANVRDYAIFLMDTDGIIHCWGEGARLMKWWTRQQAEGAHLRMLYPDGGSEDGTAESHLQTAADTGEYSGEGHRMRSDGSTFWAHTTLTALRNPEGTLVGFTKVTRDFSARRAVEAAWKRELAAAPDGRQSFEEANRLKRLLASVSHEVRTPLNAMLGSIELLDQQASGESTKPHLERLRRNGRHLLEILNDVLDMARIEASHTEVPITMAVNRVGAAVEEALADVEGQAAARQVAITNAVSGISGDVPYLGDAGRVRQIVVNLLTNAIKFTEPGGRITVSGGTGETVTGALLAGSGPWVYIRVEDTGRGIPPDQLDTIFEPYTQSERSDERRGTGLGLAISRQLARRMGGDVTVRSDQGIGSQFTLWLPLAPSDPVPR